MPALTRRRHSERPHCWDVYFGDVHIGGVTIRPGVPVHAHQWGWSIGFYPLDQRGKSRGDTAESFDAARAAFEAAWKSYLPLCTEADFAQHRRQRAFTAWKYAMHDRGLPLPTQSSRARSRCFCGAEIDIAAVDRHIEDAHMTVLQPA
jgi:hypothetical protein